MPLDRSCFVDALFDKGDAEIIFPGSSDALTNGQVRNRCPEGANNAFELKIRLEIDRVLIFQVRILFDEKMVIPPR